MPRAKLGHGLSAHRSKYTYYKNILKKIKENLRKKIWIYI
jgi:hypothetical protein